MVNRHSAFNVIWQKNKERIYRMQMIKAYFRAEVTPKRYLIPVWVLKGQKWRRKATHGGEGGIKYTSKFWDGGKKK